MVLLAKALSGGHVPVGVVLTRKWIFDKLFNRMDRAVVHGSTFAKNDMAMAAGLATLDVLDEEQVIENAAAQGERLLMAAFRAMSATLRAGEGCARQGPHDRRRVRRAQILALKMAWKAAGDGEQGPVLPDDHDPAVQGSQDPGPGRGTCEPHHQAACRRSPSPTTIAPGSKNSFEATIAAAHKVPGVGLVARQDARRARGADERELKPSQAPSLYPSQKAHLGRLLSLRSEDRAAARPSAAEKRGARQR